MFLWREMSKLNVPNKNGVSGGHHVTIEYDDALLIAET
jgi:hypothetical protein